MASFLFDDFDNFKAALPPDGRKFYIKDTAGSIILAFSDTYGNLYKITVTPDGEIGDWLEGAIRLVELL